MMIKSLLNIPGDFDKTLRLRRAVAIGLLAVGAVAIASDVLLVHQSTLPDFAQGFYLGAGAGILLGAVILLIRTQYLLCRPKARKKAQIREQDEREQTIVNRSFLVAGLITFFLSAAALFVVLPLSLAAFHALLAVLAVYSIVFLGANIYFSKTL